MIGRDEPRSQNGAPYGKSLKKTPYIIWVFMGCNPQEFLGKAINTMSNWKRGRKSLLLGDVVGKYFLFLHVQPSIKGNHMIQNLRIIFSKGHFSKWMMITHFHNLRASFPHHMMS